MTNPYDAPSPEANRAQWLADHPDASPVDAGTAAAETARQLGGAAPSPGVSGEALGRQMLDQGARAGLPAEDDHDAQMRAMAAQFEDMQQRIAAMERQRSLEHQAAIAALGEPILERYAKGIRDKMHVHQAMHPALGEEHFGRIKRTADKLYDAAQRTIRAGANDTHEVIGLANEIDRWVTKTHPRLASNAHHVDFSALLADLEMMLEEAAKLGGGVLAHVL